jgi:hypothetical protein
LLCVGATKAGTSWLNEYLAAHPDCHLRTVKELHYFDAYDFGGRVPQIAHLERQAEVFERRLTRAEPERVPVLAAKARDRRDLAALLARDEDDLAYVDYLCTGRWTKPLVGDMTPASGLLSAERLRAMAALRPDVRFLYILRDPVARLWSHVRMMAHRRGAADAGRAAKILHNTLAGAETEIAKRSDYRGALERLWAAVDPARLMVMFYEDMMTLPGMRRICAFLGIAAVEPDLATRVHEGPVLAIQPAQASAARAWLAPQYDFVADRLGPVPEAWQAARAGA